MSRTAAISVLLIILAVIALIAHVSTTTLEFSRYNRAWNGTSGLFTELDAHNARDVVLYDDLEGRNDTLLLIIAPDTPFSDSEADAIRDFLLNGNTLFLADETGGSSSLLDQIGIKTRIRRVNIASLQREFTHYSSVIAYTREPDPLLANVSTLTLNRPSVTNGGVTLVSTSVLTWEEINKDFYLDENENLSSFGILAREQVGNGTLYVFSDPSIFVNGMRDAKLSSDNEVFIRNLLSLHRDILVDQTHSLTGEVDSVLAVAIWVKNSTLMKISLLFISILCTAVAFNRRWI
jgi:hypothetical protein